MKRWQIVLGIILIVLGVFSLVEAIFGVDLWRFLGPLLLVGLGLLLIFRPRFAGPGVQVQMPLLGELRKDGAWEATDQEIWWLVGTNRLDFTDAVFPKGAANIKLIGLVVDVKLTLPEDVGLAVDSAAFVTELNSPEGKEERILSSIDYQSPNYLAVEKQVNLQTIGFVTEIRAKRS